MLKFKTLHSQFPLHYLLFLRPSLHILFSIFVVVGVGALLRHQIISEDKSISRTFLVFDSSSDSEDDMDTRVGVNNIRNLTDLQGEGCLLKRCLHLTGPKEAKISTLLSRATLAIL